MRDLEHITSLVDRMTAAPTFEAAARSAAEWARELTACESAIVRLRQPSREGREWMPVVAASGATQDFLRDETLVDDSECLCGRVGVGSTDSGPPFYTEGGSFLWGHVGSLESEFSREAVGDTRGRCIAEGYESLAIIPLMGVSGHIGCIHLADHRPDLFQADAELLEAAGRMAGRLLQNHQEQDSERAALEAIREALLPARPPTVRGVELGVFATTAEALMRVGGDFYDVFELAGGRVALVAGDYSGKGLDAVGTAARLRHRLAAHAAAAADPGSFLQEANETLADILSARRFASVVCCTLDHENGRLHVSLAGHPAPLRLRAGVVEELVAPPNLPLGIDPGCRFESVSFSLQEDDVLVLFTDGVTEARYEGILFGVEGIGRIIKDEATTSLTEIARAVVTAAAAHHDPSLPNDDRLVLLARVPGSVHGRRPEGPVVESTATDSSD